MNTNSHLYIVNIANNEIRCSFRYEKTASFFHDYLLGNDIFDGDHIAIDSYDEELWAETGNELDAYGEFSLLCGPVSDYLLRKNGCLIHAVAFRFKDKAYVIFGPPGRGKSTQIKYLMDLYPGEFSVICGDRPCLKVNDDGRIMVYPTPWNGKENWHGAQSCELGGFLYLLRGESTEIKLLDEKRAVFPVFISVISRREDVETIRLIGNITEKVVKNYPVYQYVNGGVPESSKVLYDTIFNEVNQNEI